MDDHDPACRAKHMPVETDIDDLEGCDCALLAKVRAEYEGEREAWEETMRRYVDGVLADLRAKVEALRDKWQRSVDRDPDGKLSGYDRAHVAALGDVLALMDEGGSDA